MLRLIDESHAPVVVVGRNYLTKPEIISGLRKRYPLVLRHGEVTVYVRSR